MATSLKMKWQHFWWLTNTVCYGMCLRITWPFRPLFSLHVVIWSFLPRTCWISYLLDSLLRYLPCACVPCNGRKCPSVYIKWVSCLPPVLVSTLRGWLKGFLFACFHLAQNNLISALFSFLLPPTHTASTQPAWHIWLFEKCSRRWW